MTGDPQMPGTAGSSMPGGAAGAREELLAGFRRDGYLVIGGVLPQERIAGLLGHLHREYPGHVGADKPDDFFKVGKRRIVAPVRYAAPFDCADIVTHPLLSDLLAAILGDDYVLEAFGVISSLPGAEEQHVHRDGGILFPDTGIDRLLPPSALTAVIPLLAMNEVTGKTAFWPGSHRSGEAERQGEGVAPEIPAGSLAIWDFRIFHGGLANLGKQARPLLYLTACRPFWIDHRNFVPGRNAKLLASQAALDALDETARARFARAEIVA